MNAVATATFAAIALSCSARDVTAVIPVQDGTVGRVCYVCQQQERSASLRCSPDVAEECSILMSDVKGPRPRRGAGARPYPECFDSSGSFIEADASADGLCTVRP